MYVCIYGLRNLEQSFEKAYFIVKSKNHPPPLWKQTFIAVFTNAHKLSSFSARPIDFTSCQSNVKIRLNNIFPPPISSKWTSCFTLIQQKHLVMRRDRIISPQWRELDTVLLGLGVTNCMKRTFLSNSELLSSVKTFHFFFDKAVFQYLFHNSESLVGMLSHKNTVHIVTTKAIFGK